MSQPTDGGLPTGYGPQPPPQPPYGQQPVGQPGAGPPPPAFGAQQPYPAAPPYQQPVGAPPMPGAQPYGPPPGYGYPPPGAGYGYPPPSSSSANTLAIVSIVLAFLFSPAGIVCGAIALNQSKREPQQQSRNLALVGLVLSVVMLIIGIVYVVVTRK